jgi:hypothetical protein
MSDLYRKRPVVVEARQFTNRDHLGLAKWCGGSVYGSLGGSWVELTEGDVSGGWPYELRIPTLEGVMVASFGDWIIKGVQGEFYPCKPDIFEATYEKIEDTDDPS